MTHAGNNMFYVIILFIFSFFSLLQAQEVLVVIGIGRLGICTALCFERAGYNIIGVDLNQSYADLINNKTLNSPEPFVNEYLKNSSNFKVTCSLDEGLNSSDIYYIMVDTPSTCTKEAYDHSKLSKLLAEINKRKLKNKHIVIGCTVFPGYIRNVGTFLLRDCVNTTLSYNPEFISQGNIIQDFQNPDIILIGEGTNEIGNRLEAIYKKVCFNAPKICRMSPESAEIAKLAINCFITTKISYANMIGDIADKTFNANKFEILEAVGGDKRIGNLCLKPGYGFGGPCFPRDNRAIGNYAEQIGIEAIIPHATDLSNKLHTKFMVEQLLKENKAEYIFENVTYKNDCAVPIIEESQKLVIAKELAKLGKCVIIIDKPSVISLVQQEFGNIFKYREKI
jgi:nucleotide sugar dehydrogenase